MKYNQVREEDVEKTIKRGVSELRKFGLEVKYHIEDTPNGKQVWVLVNIPSMIDVIRNHIRYPSAKSVVQGEWFVVVVGG